MLVLEPEVGIEPTVYPLRRDCFTTEPLRPSLERVTGIGPVSSAWEADALPLSYTRRTQSTPFFAKQIIYYYFGCRLELLR